MYTKFVCASENDNGKVTLQLAQLDDNMYDTDGVPRSLLHRESRLIVTIKLERKRVEITFKVNRFNKDGVATTAATNAWPHELLGSPRIGRGVVHEVVGVMYV